MLVLKNANLYAPAPMGLQDILVEGKNIAHIAPHITDYDHAPQAQILDLQGRTVVPGYIDNHLHITGGGGEGGPATRTPEASIEELLQSGITTAVGLLGTDTVTRSLENLLAKTRALNIEGITCYCLTGGYGVPPVTLCGSVERDIALIDRIIGVKTAMSDHRSSNPAADDLIRLGTQARRAGMMAGCSGIVTIHVGSGEAMLESLMDAISWSDLPASQFLPTHMGRSDNLFDQGLALVGRGGQFDLTAGSTREEQQKDAEKVLRYFEHHPRGGQLSISSDGFGSQPKFDEYMRLVGLSYASPKSLHQLVKLLVLEKGLPLELALSLLTTAPARILGLGRKGSISPGMDADFVIYDEAFMIDSVIAKGTLAIQEKTQLLRSTFC